MTNLHPDRGTLPPLPAFGASTASTSLEPATPLPWADLDAQARSAPGPASPGNEPVLLPRRDPLEALPVPLAGNEYLRVLAPLRGRWGRAVMSLGIVLAWPCTMFVALFVSLALIVSYTLTLDADATANDIDEQVIDFLYDPLGATTITLVGSLLIVFCLASLSVYGDRATGLLWSVTGRLRWSRVVLGTMIALAVVSVPGVVSTMMYFHWAPSNLSWLALALAIPTSLLATTTIEIARGWLLTWIGGWCSPRLAPWVAIPATTLIMAVALGAIQITLFVGYVLIGLAAAWLAWKSGGIELSIALTTPIALVAHVTAAFWPFLAAAVVPHHGGLDWPTLGLLVLQLALATPLLWWFGRRQQRVTSGEPGRPSPIAG